MNNATLEQLKQRAKDGDLQALAELRRTGYFETRRAQKSGAAVTHAQRRMWILDQMEGDTAAYNMTGALLLTGIPDTAKLAGAMQQVARRHECLRTRFVMEAGELRQFVEDVEIPWGERDFRSEPDAEDAARRFIRQQTLLRFDLTQAPLLNATLLRIDDDQWVLFLCAHHIICDGWSTEIIARDLLKFYVAAVAETSPNLPAPGLTYAEYARQQNQLLQSRDAEPHRTYWHSRLAGDLPALELLSDRARPATRTSAGKTVLMSLPSRIQAGLEELSRQRRATTFMTLVALVKILLHRYSGEEDIAIGTPYAARDESGVAENVGLYVNTLVLRDTIGRQDAISDVVDKVRQTAIEACEHQIYPFDRLVDELHVRRDTARSPLFDVVVLLEHDEFEIPEIPGLRVSSFDCEYDVAKFDLTFAFSEQADGLHLALNYSTDLYEPETIQRMLGHLERVAEAAVDDAGTSIADVELVTDVEQEQIFGEFNATAASYPRDRTLVDLFEAQAAESPESTALICGNEQLTYGQLNQRANQIAWGLISEYGVERGDFVVIGMDRSDWTVAAIMGVLKAGAAYVPVDAAWPPERAAFVQRDCGARIALVEPHAVQAAESEVADLRSCAIVDVRVLADGQATGNPAVVTDPAETAYVIYTSGSTGQPKGCLVTHRNVVRLMKNDRQLFDFSADDVWIVAHSFAFDFSVWEMYGALLNGARLVVADVEQIRDVNTFHGLLIRHRVSILNQTPAAFLNLARYEQDQDSHRIDEHLRLVIFGGDRLEPVQLRPWTELYPLDRIPLINMYGITETTVHVTWHEITEVDVSQRPGCSPIGRPLPETQVFVCSEHLALQPVGAIGELYVGGTGVSNGYLNRDVLTKQRFVRDPWRDSGTLYRTGDLGRWRPDGTLEYLGRNDQQLQIRGFRIEAGEIEWALVQHPSVRQAAVTSRSDEISGLRLVAGVVPQDSAVPTVDELRVHLAERLPEYMIPSSFVFCEQLPQTSNGKVDRRALAAAEPERPHLRQKLIEPRNEIESVLTNIYQDVLKLDAVGVEDNFFDLGGDSLSATRVVARVRADFRQSLRLPDVFRFSTVAGLAKHLQSEEETPGRTLSVARALLRLSKMSPAEKAEFLAAMKARRSGTS